MYWKQNLKKFQLTLKEVFYVIRQSSTEKALQKIEAQKFINEYLPPDQGQRTYFAWNKFYLTFLPTGLPHMLLKLFSELEIF